MPRYDDDDYEPRPLRRSKTSKYYADDDDSDTPRSSRRRAPHAPEAPSTKDKRSARDYGDPRDIEPRSSGSDRDRKSRRPAYGSSDDYHSKLSSKKDKDRLPKIYDEDDSIAPLHKRSAYRSKDLDSDILPPRKNEGRPRRSNTADLDDFPSSVNRRASKRDYGYDGRREQRPSRYDNDGDDSVAAKPSRPKYGDRSYKSHDEYRPKAKKQYASDSDRDVAPHRSARHRDSYDDYRRSDRDRDRGYRSVDENKRRDKYAGRSDRDRDRGKDRFDYHSDRERERSGYGSGHGASSSKKAGNKYGIKLDPDSIRGYYETGAKHYQTFKPLINSMAKMYMDSRKA